MKMNQFTFENYQFEIQKDGFIPLIEFAEVLFELDVHSLADMTTLPPDKELFKQNKIVHNLQRKNVKIEPDPMFPEQTFGTVWEGGIHKDSFTTYVKIVRELQQRSTSWFEGFVDDYNKEVKDRNKMDQH